jgi:hypothetical protein
MAGQLRPFEEEPMKDVLVVLMTLGFFGICVGYVRLCDRIVGPDEPEVEAGSPDEPGATAATTSAAATAATEVAR